MPVDRRYWLRHAPTLPETWYFTVEDDALYNRLSEQTLEGWSAPMEPIEEET